MDFFFEFLTPSTLGGGNFFNSFPFLTIFSALDVPIRGVQVLFGHHKHEALPLDPAYLECLNVLVTNQFTQYSKIILQ
jgi:hypothetical protein